MRLHFTAIESDLLRHRLDHLAQLDADALAELFPDYEEPEALAELARHASAQLYDGQLCVTVADVGTLLVLEDAAEGTTIHEAAEGAVSRQKLAAYKAARETAYEKVFKALATWEQE